MTNDNNTNYVLDAYEQYMQNWRDIVEVLTKYFNNDNVDVEKRWEVYLKTYEAFPYMNANQFDHLFNDDKIYQYVSDSYYIQVYKKIEFKDLILYLLESLYDDTNKYSDSDLKVIERDLMLTILKSGYRGVKFKW